MAVSENQSITKFYVEGETTLETILASEGSASRKCNLTIKSRHRPTTHYIDYVKHIKHIYVLGAQSLNFQDVTNISEQSISVLVSTAMKLWRKIRNGGRLTRTIPSRRKSTSPSIPGVTYVSLFTVRIFWKYPGIHTYY